MEVLLLIGAVALMALGMLELAATLSLVVWGRGQFKGCCLIVPVTDSPAAELRLRAAWSGLRWSRFGPELVLAVVDCCEQEEGSQICRAFCREKGCLLIKREELPWAIDGICKLDRDVL